MKFCQIHKIHEWIKCKNPALESDIEGLCLLHSRLSDKDNGLFIKHIELKIMNEDYDFAGIYFPCDIHFSGITFKKSVDFRGAIFSGRSNFIKVNFNDEIRFDGSVFLKTADFNRATFFGIANFSNITFKSEIYFVASIFKEMAFFDNTKFYGEGNFTASLFYSQVSFFMIEIFGKLIFQNINPPKKDATRDEFRSDCGFMNIHSDGVIIYQDLSLAKVQFFGTDMRLIKLYNVDWYNLFGRKALFDDVLLNKREINLLRYVIGRIRKKIASSTKEQYYRIKVLYRYLKINYEKEGDLKQAGDFHYGEMNMHRKANFWRRRIPISWYNLYWALSGYGERPSWALGWLVVFLVGMAGIVWGLGLNMSNPPHLAGFGESFIYILQKTTLQRPTWAEPIGFWGKLVAGLSVLLIPGQAALSLLALRHRLGRRR
jgi:uncharacterized protein YjbI with pentapeptide repeats